MSFFLELTVQTVYMSIGQIKNALEMMTDKYNSSHDVGHDDMMDMMDMMLDVRPIPVGWKVVGTSLGKQFRDSYYLVKY